MQSWTTLPEAAALLAACAVNPPNSERWTKQYPLTRDEGVTFDETDGRVIRLNELRDRWMDDVWTPALNDVAGNGGREAVFDAAIEVDAAISAAIAGKTIVLARVA